VLLQIVHDGTSAGPHGSPSGREYLFRLDEQGRRVAVVEDEGDRERFLSIRTDAGLAVWTLVESAEAVDKPKRKRSTAH
jgi:hypothetical protein